ncbi:tRNA pseudouridine synthase 1 [Cladochytrium tenue]|nr:tRNA pseudouridine synthase 1 [Cladochytrium tenue]
MAKRSPEVDLSAIDAEAKRVKPTSPMKKKEEDAPVILDAEPPATAPELPMLADLPEGDEDDPSRPIRVPKKNIESDLFKALEESGAVSKDNIEDPRKFGYARCARTDKGVHAAGQVASIKLIFHHDIVSRVNDALPDQIRVFDIIPVTQGFHAKNKCDSRIYEYLLPTYVLQPPSKLLYPDAVTSVEDKTKTEAPIPLEPATGASGGSSFRLSKDSRTSFRLSEDALGHLRSCLKEYVGTHNFHNFTVNCAFQSKGAKRYIRMFEDVVRPFVKKWIHSRMVEEELLDCVFIDWLELVDRHAPQFSWYLNETGELRLDRQPSTRDQPDDEGKGKNMIDDEDGDNDDDE